MTAAIWMTTAPRYGSAAQMAALSGLSLKTIRRMVDAGSIRGFKVGRRLLIPFEDFERHIIGRTPLMATIPKMTEGPFLAPVSDEEQARRNREAIALLDSWETEGDEQEQRETMEILRKALGKDRVASSRNLFP